ncbi:MAG: MATE family efflux transporter [Pseudomonadota bacterium]
MTAPDDEARAGATERPPYAEALRLAIPAALAAAVTPLLGLADVFALGRSARPLDVAAVGLGAVVFSLAYWSFGFVRMSVAGLVAQANGAGDRLEERAALYRGAAIGGAIGLALIVLKAPIEAIAVGLLGAGSEASAATLGGARGYVGVRLWGAPFALATYALLGFLTAKGRTDYLFAVAAAATALNAALDLWFVLGLGWGPRGVALGTLIAETAGFFLAAGLSWRLVRANDGDWRAPRARLFEPGAVRRTLAVNRDVFIRTLLLTACLSWFIQRGGQFGDAVLAANHALFQMFLFTGLALDGTAIAAETLVGRAIGDPDAARRAPRIKAAILATGAPALAAALVFAVVYAGAGASILALLVDDAAIRGAGVQFLPWVAASPLVVVAAFQLDGIFIGATRAREMRDGMIISTLIFLPMSVVLADRFGNHGLWAAFMLYLVARAGTLARYLPRVWRV